MVVVEHSSSKRHLAEKLAEKLRHMFTSGGSNCDGQHRDIALSGGSAANLFAEAFLKLKPCEYNLSLYHFYLADERYVPLTDKDSNYRLLSQCLFEKISIPSPNVFHINPDVDVDRCANEYSELINTNVTRKSVSGVPIFDLIVLGMGGDGHVCSLFPNSPLLQNFDDQIESKLWVAPVRNSPKPPPNRVTFTMPLLDASERIFVVSFGPEKQDALGACFKRPNNVSMPASILCRNEATFDDSLKRIHWFVDENGYENITHAISRQIR